MEKEQEIESVENFIDKLLEQDDDFPEFDDVHAEWVGKERGKETSVKWKQDEWDDDDNDAKDDFSLQLKKELDNSSKKDGSST